MGSSLMSARAYDSDAQFIGSPQHGGHMKKPLKSPESRRTRLDDLIEHSRERQNSELWSGATGHTQYDTPEIPFGMHFIPTPPGSLRARTDTAHTSSETTGTINGAVGSIRNEEINQAIDSANSLPRDHGSREVLAPPNRNRYRDGVIGSSSENLRELVADWAHYMGSNPMDFRTASSASLAAQDQGIVISKTRQPTSSPVKKSETWVPHLGDLDLSHRLAATNMVSGPPSDNPSMCELPRPNRYGLQMVSQENLESYEKAGSSTALGNEYKAKDVLHRRDASSFYSRQSSNVSGGASPAAQSLRVHALSPTKNMPNIHTQMVENADLTQNGVESTTEVLKSKFIEQLDTGNLDTGLVQAYAISNENNGLLSQRKVSPGWMTGGRRMGYGYTLVDNAEEHLPTAEDGRDPPGSGSWCKNAQGPTPGTLNGCKLNSSILHQTDAVTPAQPVTPDQGLKKSNSKTSLMTTVPIDSKGEPILTPKMWAKLKSHSIRRNAHAPLALDSTGNEVTTDKGYHADSRHTLRGKSPKSPTYPKGEYVEDTTETTLGRWARARLSTNKRALPAKNLDQKHVQDACAPKASPQGERRFSMDQTNRPPSIYFDPSNNRSADKLNRVPSQSQSGRWVLRFSRRRESKRRSNLSQRELSSESAIQYQEHAGICLERANSTRSDVAEQLASAYQDCIQMPGAFYGSRWASRTSLVVEAE